MNKKLYLMRHGETLFNTQHKIQGWCDTPLTENGKRQALRAKAYFLKKGIIFDHAYCSTSERTEDTLKLVSSLPYVRLKELKDLILTNGQVFFVRKEMFKDEVRRCCHRCGCCRLSYYS